MKPFILIAAITLVVSSCNHYQEATIKDIATPKPTRQMAKLNNRSYEDLVEGRRVYDTSCVKCHENRLPNTVTMPEWHKTIHHMSEKSGLTSNEEESLQAYLEIFSDR